MNNQTSWIAASLFIGFVVYITIRGELAKYKAAILGGQTQGTAMGAAGNPANPSGSESGILPAIPLGPA